MSTPGSPDSCGEHSPLAPDVEDRVEEIAERFLDELHAGRSPDRRAWVAAHPDLAAVLDERLELRERMYRAARLGRPVSDREAAQPAAHELLIAALAFQNEYIDLAQFSAACRAWVADKTRPLAERLVERGWIDTGVRRVLEEIASRKLRRYGGDLHTTLGAVAESAVRDAIRDIDDSELQKSLSSLPPAAGHVLVSVAGSAFDDATEPPRPMSTIDGPPGMRSRYTLMRLHGEGGLGRVWLARDGQLGRDVALKELQPKETTHTDAWRRFLREAQVTGQLEHPNIVPVYELGRHPEDEHPFYTMRFVRGRTLHEAIAGYHGRAESEGDPLEFRRLLDAFVSVCHAIGYAHSRGVVHRDLKPANVVLGDFGEVIVLDWGLAKVLGSSDADSHSLALDDTACGMVTAAGRILGTPAYMAPEQAQGRIDAIDARTDIYGLGCVLFEVLTGRAPFGGADTDGLLRQIIDGATPRAREMRPAVPAALDAICFKAMARAREARYADAGALAADVERWLADEPTSVYRDPLATRFARWSRRHRPLVVGTAALLVAAVVALSVTTWLVARAQRQTDKARHEAVIARDAEAKAAQQAIEQEKRAKIAGIAAARAAIDSFHASADQLLETATRLRASTAGSDAQTQAIDTIAQAAALRGDALRTIEQMPDASPESSAAEACRWDDRLLQLRNEATHWLTDLRLTPGRSLALARPPDGHGTPDVAISPDSVWIGVAWPGSRQIQLLDADGSPVRRLELPAGRTVHSAALVQRSLFRSSSVERKPYALGFASERRLEYATEQGVLAWRVPEGTMERGPRQSRTALTLRPAETAVNEWYEARVTGYGATVTMRELRGDSAERVVWHARAGHDSPERCVQIVFGAEPRALFVLTNQRLCLVDASSGWMAAANLDARTSDRSDGLMIPTRQGIAIVDAETGPGDRSTRLDFWNAQLPRIAGDSLHHDRAAQAISVARDGLIVTGSADHMVQAWRESRRVWSAGVAHLEPYDRAGRATPSHALPSFLPLDDATHWSLGGLEVFEESRNWRRTAWSRRRPAEPLWKYAPPEPVSWWSFAPHGKRPFAVKRVAHLGNGRSHEPIELVAADDGQLLHSFGTQGVGRTLSVSGSYDLAVVVAAETTAHATLELWSLQDSRAIGRLGEYVIRHHPALKGFDPPIDFHFLPAQGTSKWLLVSRATGSAGGAELQVWRMPDCRLVGKLVVPAVQFSVRLDESGRRAVLDRKRSGILTQAAPFARVIDLESATKLCDLTGLEESVSFAPYVMAGDWLVEAVRHEDGSNPYGVTAWNLLNGVPVVLGGSSWMNSKPPGLLASPDKRRLLIVGAEHETGMARLELWDLESAARLQAAVFATKNVPELASFGHEFVRLELLDYPRGTSTRVQWRCSDGRELLNPRQPADQILRVIADGTLCHGPNGFYVERGSNSIALEGSKPFSRVTTGQAGRVVLLQNPGAGLWDMRSGRRIAMLPDGHRFRAFDADERWMLTVHESSSEIGIWSTATGELARHFNPLRAEAASFDPAGASFELDATGERVAVLAQGILRLWDATANRQIKMWERPGHFSPVTCVAQHDGAGLVASGGLDGAVLFWTRDDGRLRSQFVRPHPITHLMFTPDGQRIVCATTEGTVALCNLDGGEVWTFQHGPGTTTHSLAMHPNNSSILVGTGAGKLLFLEAASGKSAAEATIDTAAISAITFTADQAMMATATIDGRVQLWHTSDRQPWKTLDTHAVIHAAAFLAGHRMLATGGTSIHVWDTHTGELCWTIPVSDGPVRALHFRDETSELIVIDQGNSVRVHPLAERFAGLTRLQLGFEGFTPRETASRSAESAGDDWRQWQSRGVTAAAAGRWEAALVCGEKAIELNRESWQAWHLRGLACLKLGQAADAVADFSAAIALGADGWSSWCHRGSAYAKLGDWSKAVEDCSRAIEKGATDHSAWFDRGRARGQLGQHALAVADLDQAIAIDPNHADSYAARGRAHAQLRQTDSAVRDLDAAIRLDPADSSKYLERARVHLAASNMEPALADFNHAIRLDPDRTRSLVERGVARRVHGDHAAAIADFTEALRRNPADTAALSERAETYRGLGQHEPAIADETARIRFQPSAVSAYLARGQSFEMLAQYDRAVTDFSRGIELAPNDSRGWALRGHALAYQRNWQAAASDFARAVELAPASQPLANAHAMTLLGSGDTQAYLEACSRMIERFGATDQPAVANDVAWACARVPGNPTTLARALELAENAVAAKPDQYAYQNTLGAVLYRLGRFTDAASALDRAVQLHGQGGTAHDWLLLALVHHALGQDGDARRWLAKAIEWLDRPPPPSQPSSGTGDEPAAQHSPTRWQLRLELDVLRREAESSIAPQNP